MTPLNYPIRLGSDDFEGIQCIVSTLVDRYRGNFATSKSVTDYNTPLRYHGNGANHIQRILHAVILNGPIVHASLETFEGEPNATYLRVEIKEGSRALDHYAKNTMPLAYPPIARLLAVVTTISLPQPSRYHPDKKEVCSISSDLTDKYCDTIPLKSKSLSDRPCSVAAIDCYVRPGDITRLIRGEEQDGMRDPLGMPTRPIGTSFPKFSTFPKRWSIGVSIGPGETLIDTGCLPLRNRWPRRG